MGHIVDKTPRGPVPTKAFGKKPYSVFIVNLLKQEAITSDMAETLYLLPNPPLQFQAMMRLRQQPGKSLSAIVQEMLMVPPELPRAWTEKSSTGLSLQWLSKKLLISVGRACVFVLAGYVCWINFPAAGYLYHNLKSAKVTVPALPAPTEMALAPYVPAAVAAPAPLPDPAPLAVAAAIPALPVAASPMPAPVRSVVPSASALAPQHLSARWQEHGMVHLAWDPVGPASEYRIYTSESADFHGSRILRQEGIPMPWWDWMPPEGPLTLWVAVTRLQTSSGRESPLSTPVQVIIP